MKFNDEYDSEKHMELVGKYVPGRKRKVLFLWCLFDSRISLQVAPIIACNSWPAWMKLMEAVDRPFDSAIY